MSVEPEVWVGIEPETRKWLDDTSQADYVERLRAGLKARGMSGAAFARYCGTSPSNMSCILRGQTGVPKYVWAAADRLGLVQP